MCTPIYGSGDFYKLDIFPGSNEEFRGLVYDAKFVGGGSACGAAYLSDAKTRKYHSLPRSSKDPAVDIFRDLIRRAHQDHNKSDRDSVEDCSVYSTHSLRSSRGKKVNQKKGMYSSTPMQDLFRIKQEAEVTGTLIDSITKLKNLVKETRIIDEVDDELWLLNFIDELEVHLADLCRRNFTKHGKPGIQQKEILLQVCIDLICYLEKRTSYSKDKKNGDDDDDVEKHEDFFDQSWENRIKRLLTTLDQCLNSLKNHINLKKDQDSERVKLETFVKMSNKMLQSQSMGNTPEGSYLSDSENFNYSFEGDSKVLTISIIDKNDTNLQEDKESEASTHDSTQGDSCDSLMWDDSTHSMDLKEDSGVQCDLLSPQMFQEFELRVTNLKKNLNRFRRKLRETLEDRNDKSRQILTLQNRMKRFQRTVQLKKMEKSSLEEEISMIKDSIENEKILKETQIGNLERKLDKIQEKHDQDIEKIDQLYKTIDDYKNKNEVLRDEQIKLFHNKEETEKELHQATVSLLKERSEMEKLRENPKERTITLDTKEIQTETEQKNEIGCQTSTTSNLCYKCSNSIEQEEPETSSNNNTKIDFGCQVDDESYMNMKAYDFYAKEAKIRARKLIERGRNFQRESIKLSRQNQRRSNQKTSLNP